MNNWFLQLNALAAAWLEALWRASWQGGIGFILVWAICCLFQRLPARARSWLWRLAYLKLLVAFFWATPIDLPLLPAEVGPPATEARFQAALAADVGAPSAGSARPAGPASRTVSDLAVRAEPAPAAWLLSMWALGVIYFGVWTWRELRHTRRVERTCRPVRDPILLQCLSELAQCFRLSSVPVLFVSDAVASPLLLLAWRSAIVLPARLASVSTHQHLRLMLAHEMAHVKRFDLRWAWLAVAGEGLFFFHPLVWLARRQWRLAQEMACDELALRVTRTPVSTYGDMLVGAAALSLVSPRAPFLLTVKLTETKQMLVKRLNAMKLLNSSLAKRTILFTTAVLAGGILNLLPWRLTAQPSVSVPAGGAAASPAAQPSVGGGGGFDPAMSQDPATTQQMIANAQQAMAQMDPSQVQQMAATFDPFVAQMDPEQFKQAFQQSQQQMQAMAQMEPSQFQQMLEQAQQQMQAFAQMDPSQIPQFMQQQGFDPAQVQRGSLASLREQLGITNDTEWSVVEGRIQKVREAQRAVQNDTVPGGFAPLNVASNSLSTFFSRLPGRAGQTGGPQAFGGGFATAPEAGAVQRAVEGRAPNQETRAAIDKLLEVRKAHRAALEKAQASLREVLTLRQEAVATLNGLL